MKKEQIKNLKAYDLIENSTGDYVITDIDEANEQVYGFEVEYIFQDDGDYTTNILKNRQLTFTFFDLKRYELIGNISPLD